VTRPEVRSGRRWRICAGAAGTAFSAGRVMAAANPLRVGAEPPEDAGLGRGRQGRARGDDELGKDRDERRV